MGSKEHPIGLLFALSRVLVDGRVIGMFLWTIWEQFIND